MTTYIFFYLSIYLFVLNIYQTFTKHFCHFFPQFTGQASVSISSRNAAQERPTPCGGLYLFQEEVR